MTSSSRLMPIGIVTTLTVFMLIALNDARSYELITHAQISEAAFDPTSPCPLTCPSARPWQTVDRLKTAAPGTQPSTR